MSYTVYRSPQTRDLYVLDDSEVSFNDIAMGLQPVRGPFDTYEQADAAALIIKAGSQDTSTAGAELMRPTVPAPAIVSLEEERKQRAGWGMWPWITLGLGAIGTALAVTAGVSYMIITRPKKKRRKRR